MEQVLHTCCGFLHDMNPETEIGLIERFLNKSRPDSEFEARGLKRRAFLVTSIPVEGSAEFLPGRFIQTLTPWDPAKASMPEGSHHVSKYDMFKTELILGKTVLNIAGFDGDVNTRENDFLSKDATRPDLPHLCILSNQQHDISEAFLLKHGYKAVCRGRNQFWYNNHLTVFVKPATKTSTEAGTGANTKVA